MNGVTYNARGQVTGWSHGNGLTTVREYDATTERPTRIFSRRVSPELRLQDLAYAYDPVGNPVAITDQLASSTFTSNNIITNTRRYGYDPRYRLIRSMGKRHKNATDGIDAPLVPTPAPTDYVPYTHRYAYDAVGNFTTNQEYTRSALKYKAGLPDRFDGTGAEVYGYDANGNTTSTPRHTSLGYQWDSHPTLIDMGGGGKVRYRRHGDQKVLRFKSTGFRLTLGVWEYENRTAATAFTKTTLHVAGPAGRCAQVEKVLTGADATSLPVFHVHGDHLGSGQCLTKADGTLLCQEEFFAYGRSSDRRDTRNRYRFIGVERDEDTGLCMTGPRTYDPVSGRFLQGDPVVGGAAYVYSRGNSVGRMDPGGYADDDAVMSPEALRQQAMQTPDITPTTTASLLEGPSQYAAPPDDPASGLNAYKSEQFRDTQFDNFTEGPALDLLAGTFQGSEALAQTPAAQAGNVISNFVPLGHGDWETFESFAEAPGPLTGAMAAATIIGVPLPAGRNGALLEMTAKGRILAEDGVPVIRNLEVAERTGLKALFGSNEAGAENLLRRLGAGETVALPEGVTRETLETYRQVATKAIDEGIDNRGTQDLRRQAIDLLLGGK